MRFSETPSIEPSSNNETNKTNINSINALFSEAEAETLRAVPGIEEIVGKYAEFHTAAQDDLSNPSLFNDQIDSRRVRDFVATFFKGDINQTFQTALQYFYANKVLNQDKKQKLEDLISHVKTSYARLNI